MPERLERLKQTLQELEAELEALSSVDQETRTMLEEAVADIQAALDEDHPAQLEPHSLADRLKEAAEQFETSHPNLFGIVSRTVDALAQMGI